MAIEEEVERIFVLDRPTKNKLRYNEEDGEGPQMIGTMYLSKEFLENIGIDIDDPPAKLSFLFQITEIKPKKKVRK
jgi:hypothetical protein